MASQKLGKLFTSDSSGRWLNSIRGWTKRERLLRDTGDTDTHITLNLDTEEGSMLLLGWMENGAAWSSRKNFT